MSTNTERDLKLCRAIYEHKQRVSYYLNLLIHSLQWRSLQHDNSKLEPEEFDAYSSQMDEFCTHEFGSPGYVKAKETIADAVNHHYMCNSHHPEHYSNGIDGMDLVDVIEMICDWKAATTNNPKAPGTMQKSFDYAVAKYGITPQLANVILNTIENYKM